MYIRTSALVVVFALCGSSAFEFPDLLTSALVAYLNRTDCASFDLLRLIYFLFPSHASMPEEVSMAMRWPSPPFFCLEFSAVAVGLGRQGPFRTRLGPHLYGFNFLPLLFIAAAGTMQAGSERPGSIRPSRHL